MPSTAVDSAVHSESLDSGHAALVLGVVMLALNLALVVLGPYELSLVGIES